MAGSALADAGVYSKGGANYASFVSDGDHFYNCDERVDGHHAVIQWVDARDPGLVHTKRNKAGAGSCQDINLQLPEHSGVTLMSCVGEGSRIYNCGNIASDRA